MATTKKTEETKKESIVLKKRTDPDATIKKTASESKMPLKKRELPSVDEVKKEDKPTIDIFSKKVKEEDNTQISKEKSSLDKMRERIAAQKKLEQDMMTKQSLRNQEKVGLRNKLSALAKEVEEDDEVAVVEKPKPKIDFDLKSEALETQNKKLKQDLEKSKQQIQALIALEYHNMKVLDPNTLTLSNEFVEAVNSIREQVEAQKNNEEQTLKDELSSLQKELSSLKAKNEAAKKASEDAQRVATQAQKAIKQAKKAIEEQENDQVRDFKKEITDLEKQVSLKTKEIAALGVEKENLLKEHETEINELKTSLENKVKELTLEVAEKETRILEINKNSKDIQEELKAKLNKELATASKQLNQLEAKVKELEGIATASKTLLKEKEKLEKQLEEQAKKIDELLMNYQRQLDEKDQEVEQLRKEIIQKEDQISKLPKADTIEDLNNQIKELEEKFNDANLNVTKLNAENEVLKQNVANSPVQLSLNEKELQEKCEQYQALLLSERNSHLQVEQKLCKDLDEYKAEIEKLQIQVTSMSSNFGLSRLNQQVDVIEKFINELKESKNVDVNRDIYNEYYEKLINDYKLEQEKFISEIEKRNKMLTLLRDEKLDIIKILQKSGKNTTVIEKQIQDINEVLETKVQKAEVVDSKEIEQIILDQVKEDLIKYCDNIKENAVKEIEEINKKYENVNSISNLVKQYNDDCENMTRAYGNEIAKLNLERELNNDENKGNAIEEKILILGKQYNTLTNERDRIFNEALSKLRTQGFEITKEQLENNYFAFVGEEYIKSLNKYAEMKQSLEEKIKSQKDRYQSQIESLTKQQQELLENDQNIKEQIAKLNAKESLNDEEVSLKQQLIDNLKNNEFKLTNLKQYGIDQVEEENNLIIKQLENDYKNIVEEESKLKELYSKRELEAKNRLEVEKTKAQEAELEYNKQTISDYIYIQEETERVIESVQEKRERLEEEQQAQVEIEESIKEIKPIIIDETNVESLSSAKQFGELDQKDLPRIKLLREEISEINYKINQNIAVKEEMKEQYERFVSGENQMSSELKDVKKYKEFISEYSIIKIESEKMNAELSAMDIKADKKAYKAKAAECKSMQHKVDYIAKHLKSLRKNKRVEEYIKLVTRIQDFDKQFEEIEKRNDELRIEISQKEIEIKTLKG